MPTIGLVMIVKNEAHIIERCLQSVRPILDYVLIADTGSTDATPEIIRAWLARANLQGQVIERPWRNFAHNRSEALAALRDVTNIDYGFTIDADQSLVVDEKLDIEAFKAGLNADIYRVDIHSGGTRYDLPLLFTNRKPLVYKAVLHEYLDVPAGSTRGHAEGLHISVSHDGARSQNPHKFEDDAKLLEAELKIETDPRMIARYTFYLAQSYRDSDQWEPAQTAYLRRAEQGFWIEEVYVSLLRAAQLSERLEQPVDRQIALYLRAFETIPARAEALCGAAAVCRKAGRYHLGYVLARHGITLPRPETGLFLDQSVYDYGMLDEFQVNAYWVGQYRESLDAAATILHDGKFPEDQRQRFVANMEYALRKVSEESGGVLPTLGD